MRKHSCSKGAGLTSKTLNGVTFWAWRQIWHTLGLIDLECGHAASLRFELDHNDAGALVSTFTEIQKAAQGLK